MVRFDRTGCARSVWAVHGDWGEVNEGLPDGTRRAFVLFEEWLRGLLG